MLDRAAVGRPGILFDVDGTLVDSSYLHVLAWDRAFVEAGYPVSMVVLHRLIGRGGDDLVSEVLDDPDAALVEEVVEAHARHMQALQDEIRPFPRAGELLEELHRRGAAVVLATSAEEEEVEHRRSMLDVDDEVVDLVVSSGDIDHAKPEPDLYLRALDDAGLEVEDCVAVGDAVWDVLAAGRLGIPCIGVLSGGISRRELEEAGAVAVYRDVAELLSQLELSPIGRLLARTDAGSGSSSGS